MRPWLVLPLIPILALVLGHSADAAGTRAGHHHGSRQASNYHHRSSYIARMTDADGWNPVEAGISAPVQSASHHRSGYLARTTDADGWDPIEAGISAPVQLASFVTPALDQSDDTDRLADSSYVRPIQTGVASYYGKWHQGRRTASGEIFDDRKMTAAHPFLPFGTRVRVEVAGTDRSIVVTITDRLFNRHRIIDLSEGAASRLGIIRAGTAMVMLMPAS
jgi:rare lipoprotein A